jgi:hypothetical protein
MYGFMITRDYHKLVAYVIWFHQGTRQRCANVDLEGLAWAPYLFLANYPSPLLLAQKIWEHTSETPVSKYRYSRTFPVPTFKIQNEKENVGCWYKPLKELAAHSWSHAWSRYKRTKILQLLKIETRPSSPYSINVLAKLPQCLINPSDNVV